VVEKNIHREPGLRLSWNFALPEKIAIPIPSVVICVHLWLKKHPSRSRFAAQVELRPPPENKT
jgi:hypothetical protein